MREGMHSSGRAVDEMSHAGDMFDRLRLLHRDAGNNKSKSLLQLVSAGQVNRTVRFCWSSAERLVLTFF